jgi:hypothetical protein
MDTTDSLKFCYIPFLVMPNIAFCEESVILSYMLYSFHKVVVFENM